ncbi:hypothetical protein BH20ACT2_BH20ACT2_09100 [soil metagenome]
MTEIPEHLLKRSRERRAALGLGGDDADAGDGAAEQTSAATADEAAPAAAATPARPEPAAAPAVPEPPPPPEPLPPHVEAAVRRKKIPIWAMPVVDFLPIWAIVYAGTLSPPGEDGGGPLAEGEAIYNSQCSSCHGATGGGGVGPALAGGAVAETFPEFADHVEWIRLGSDGWPEATYGANGTEVGASGAVMPAFGESLTDEELALVVRYERETFGGVVEEELVAITEGEATLEAGGEGEAGGEAEAEGGGEAEAEGGTEADSDAADPDSQTGAESVGDTAGAQTGEGSEGETEAPAEEPTGTD